MAGDVVPKFEYRPADDDLCHDQDHEQVHFTDANRSKPIRPDDRPEIVPFANGVSVNACRAGEKHPQMWRKTQCFVMDGPLPDGLRWFRLDAKDPVHLAIGPAERMSPGEFDALWKSIKWISCSTHASAEPISVEFRGKRAIDAVKILVDSEEKSGNVHDLFMLRLFAAVRAEDVSIHELFATDMLLGLAAGRLILRAISKYTPDCLQELEDTENDDELDWADMLFDALMEVK